MAKRLVDSYDIDYAKDFAREIKEANPSFLDDVFIDILKARLGEEAFLARQDIYVDALEQALGDDYPANLDTFRDIWGEELQQETGMFKFGWWLWPIGRYAERNGVRYPAETHDFLAGFSKRQTGEYAIRPLLEEHTAQTMQQILIWSGDANVHVRRLSSEGMRIHLPWSKKTTKAVDAFDIYRQVLANLKDDPSRFVQKSVGNNLSDLYRYDARLADLIINGWSKDELSTPAQWIIQHGQRSLRK